MVNRPSPDLVPRKKWNISKRNIRVEDFVIVADPNAIRGRWTRGRATKVFPGEDGLVRIVKVKTGTGSYRVPLPKFVLSI